MIFLKVSHKVRLTVALLVTMLVSSMQMQAAEIPANLVGEGKWVTLKTENGYYLYALEVNGQVKLGQTQVAPTTENYALYCWQIEGDATSGYTFRCLQYDDKGRKYITNPESLVTNSAEVRLTDTDTPDRYFYTDNHQFQLAENTNLYLAFYSRNYTTIRLHNSADYVGSRMIIGGIFDWSVAAVVYGTETIGDDNLPQGTYLPNGGIRYNNQNYLHGSSVYLANTDNLSIIPIEGYNHSTIKIDNENKYIVAYYIGQQSGVNYKNAEKPGVGENAITGEDNTVWALDAKNYITNTSGNYDNVPAGKAWQMELVVENTNASGNDPSFNQWGSCVIASTGDPLNTYYWGNFQIYQHSSTHSSPNTLNFKSSKGDGNDHIIAQGASVLNKSYKVIIRYNGGNVYVIRTIMLDSNLQETDAVYNNVWVSARQQVVIAQMSSAIPSGINIKSLKISIAEEDNLLENVDYSIQNIETQNYLIGHADTEGKWYSQYAGDAAVYQIERTNIQDLTFAEGDGALHQSFYVKVKDNNGEWKWLGANNTNVDDKADALPFVYLTNNEVWHIASKNTKDSQWYVDEGTNKSWYFDFFANFYVQVSGNANGGILYHKDGVEQKATNGQYILLPSGVLETKLANHSIPGYSATINKADISLKVQYSALENTFYNITAKDSEAPILYYWNRNQSELVAYGTGDLTAWGDKGDCTKYSIVKATTIPISMIESGEGWYCTTISCPNALTLPTGVKAYRLDNIVENVLMLKSIDLGNNLLPANTPVLLISYDGMPQNENWAINTTSFSSLEGTNLFKGVHKNTTNSSDDDVFLFDYKDPEIAFYPNSETTIPAFKAYYSFANASGYSMLWLNLDGIITGIEDIKVEPAKDATETVIYDLMGRRLSKVGKGGIYIVNGEKVLVK